MVVGVGKVVTLPVRLAAALVVLGLSAGCMQPPRARSVIGPDGTRVLHVSCGADQGACFEMAGQSCPFGYDLSPTFDASSNNYLVRCENRVAGIAPLIASSGARSPSLSAGWPPPPELWPPTNPWSQATGEASPQSARLPDGQLDIGY